MVRLNCLLQFGCLWCVLSLSVAPFNKRISCLGHWRGCDRLFKSESVLQKGQLKLMWLTLSDFGSFASYCRKYIRNYIAELSNKLAHMEWTMWEIKQTWITAYQEQNKTNITKTKTQSLWRQNKISKRRRRTRTSRMTRRRDQVLWRGECFLLRMRNRRKNILEDICKY